jgi:hypothetical protein
MGVNITRQYSLDKAPAIRKLAIGRKLFFSGPVLSGRVCQRKPGRFGSSRITRHCCENSYEVPTPARRQLWYTKKQIDTSKIVAVSSPWCSLRRLNARRVYPQSEHREEFWCEDKIQDHQGSFCILVVSRESDTASPGRATTARLLRCTARRTTESRVTRHLAHFVSRRNRKSAFYRSLAGSSHPPTHSPGSRCFPRDGRARLSGCLWPIVRAER